VGSCGLDAFSSGCGLKKGYCDHGYEPLGSMKDGEFLSNC